MSNKTNVRVRAIKESIEIVKQKAVSVPASYEANPEATKEVKLLKRWERSITEEEAGRGVVAKFGKSQSFTNGIAEAFLKAAQVKTEAQMVEKFQKTIWNKKNLSEAAWTAGYIKAARKRVSQGRSQRREAIARIKATTPLDVAQYFTEFNTGLSL